MSQNVQISKPSTVYIKFLAEQPKKFILYDDKDEGYYFRYLDGKTPRIKFNVPDIGKYTTNVPVQIMKIREIEIPHNLPSLPKPERDRVIPFEFSIDAGYSGVARNYSQLGLIELGSQWMQLPGPMKLFILLHEKWHTFYLTEKYCDWAAGVDFLRLGYNRSTAVYTLKLILTDNPENRQRIDDFNNFLQQTQKTKL